MRSTAFVLLLVFISAAAAFAQSSSAEVVKIDAQPSKGFSYAYYLYVPKALRETAEQAKVHSFIVIPNNTGQINDDIAFHEADVKRKISQIGAFLNTLKTPVLMPVFPRPAAHHRLYTHSLDRDTFTTDKAEYKRLDLQLVAMIKDARERLKAEKILTEEKVLLQGHSASGMFVNRFVFLHPRLVKAAIIGAPGGWPTAPVDEYEGKALTFPAGVSDLRTVAGSKFDIREVRKVPLFLVLGEKDTNDAVPMSDAYDERESKLVIELFGKTPVERWAKSEQLYKLAKLNAEFKLYPDTGHQVSKAMRDDMLAFMLKHVNK